VYELIEHTADVGLRVSAADLDELFSDAAQGLFSILVEDLAAVRPEQRLVFELQSADTESLLIDWLNELVYVFSTQRVLLSRFDVQVRGVRLRAEATGERFDPQRHRLGPEIKAVTYHGLALTRTEQGYVAEVILDV
jgi:SHS2 domain-containing protein